MRSRSSTLARVTVLFTLLALLLPTLRDLRPYARLPAEAPERIRAGVADTFIAESADSAEPAETG
ncbi:hypothetical protein [Streptomyces malaysiensis]|uniref:Uncharacterized protein n=1 Tax=Streptomyces malaysiensis TaxID=92644 RepID=A0A7X6AU98_STRMQ|nr:hypothetical protein [Streptomyces malaysiensis]NIY63009.1 hypothetical protein [Streptomyces malaysiensis]